MQVMILFSYLFIYFLKILFILTLIFYLFNYHDASQDSVQSVVHIEDRRI